MKIFLDCIPCFLEQALRICRYLDISSEIQQRIIFGLIDEIKKHFSDYKPPEMGGLVYRYIRDEVGIDDLYREFKRKDTENSLQIYPHLKELVANSENPLLVALKVSAYGNLIDYATCENPQIDREMEKILDCNFVVNDFQKFESDLNKADWILFLGDNAGETVFDRVLIEQIGIRTKFAVRGEPVINDCTVEDARNAGIDEVAEIFSSGCDTPGIILDRCSDEFKRIFYEAPLVISKGQGNFEGLSDNDRPVYFIMTVKCQLVSRHINCEIGDMVLKKNI